MPNPLSHRGVTDRDYAAAIGTLVGEVAAKGNLQDYQAVADVIANRLADKSFVGQYGPSITGQVLNPKEFSTWSPKEENAYRNAMAGFAAALNPSVTSKMSPAMQERVEFAKQAVDDVMVTGKARGIAQGATFYDNPAVTAKLGTNGFHNQLENKYGSAMIGAHRFTGPGFTDVPFDPVTYNGMLAAPAAAPTDLFTGVGIPTGQVEFAGNLPDLTPPQNAPPGDFDFGSLDPSSYTVSENAYHDLNQALGFDASPQPASAGFSMDQNTFDHVFDQGFPSQPQGFHAGFDEGPYGVTPDFSAPTAEAAFNADVQDKRASAAAMGMGFNSADLNNEAIAQSVMNELGPQTPALAAQPTQAAPSAPPQATMGFDLSKAPMGDFDMGSSAMAAPSTQAPALAAPSLPAAPAPQAPQTAPSATPPQNGLSLGPVGLSKDQGLTIGGFSNPMDAIKSGLGFDTTPDTGFMNAMASPQAARDYSPGVLDGWTGSALKGAAMGSLFGGLPGAAMGGLWGGLNLGGRLSDAFGGVLGDPYEGLSPQDLAAFAAGRERGTREATGRNESGSATRGDGSYAEGSGRNDNNPQGIL